MVDKIFALPVHDLRVDRSQALISGSGENTSSVVDAYAKSLPPFRSATSTQIRTGPSSRKASNPRSDKYRKTIEQKRKARVADVKREYQEVESRLLSKSPSELTQEERYEIAMMRRKVQLSIDDLKRYSAPYLNDLVNQLDEMRAGLYQHNDYVDKTSESYRIERKRRDRESRLRYRTRQKVQRLGINIRPWRTKPRAAASHVEEEGNVPLPIIRRRLHSMTHRQRVKSRKQSELYALFEKGWGKKNTRSERLYG